MTATEIIQLLLLADQLTAKLAGLVKNVKDLSAADEAELKRLLAEARTRNDASFAEIDAILAARAG